MDLDRAKAPSMMDVYEMLGIKPTSSLMDVRRAYRSMALLCHPDKGGDPTDMRILQSSYEYICQQLGQVALEAQKGTFEEREAEFKAFLQSQETKPLPAIFTIISALPDIPVDVWEQIKSRAERGFPDDAFLRDISTREMLHSYDTAGDLTLQAMDAIVQDITDKKNRKIVASISDGYGQFLDTCATLHDSAAGLQQPLHTSFGKQALILKPDNSDLVSVETLDFPVNCPIPEKLDDYSIRNMCDYKVAYTDTTGASSELETLMKEAGTFDKTLDAVLNERARLDKYLELWAPEKIILGRQAN